MPDNREDWLKARLNGIGASEAAAVVGCSPYLSNTNLWEIKTGRRRAKEIGEKPFVQYGTEAESHLRALFALDYPEYEVTYDQFGMVRDNPEVPFAFATLDGELLERATGRKGVLEIKTTEIMRQGQWEDWNGRVPEHYYVQVLHQLLATGCEFSVLKAQIKHRANGELVLTTRHYRFERSELLEDIAYLQREEILFWDCVKEDRRPNLKLPRI